MSKPKSDAPISSATSETARRPKESLDEKLKRLSHIFQIDETPGSVVLTATPPKESLRERLKRTCPNIRIVDTPRSVILTGVGLRPSAPSESDEGESS